MEDNEVLEYDEVSLKLAKQLLKSIDLKVKTKS